MTFDDKRWGGAPEPRATLYQRARRLTEFGIATWTGKPRWNVARIRGILRSPAYTGLGDDQQHRVASARRGWRRSGPLAGVVDLAQAPHDPAVSKGRMAEPRAQLCTSARSRRGGRRETS